MSAPSGLQLRGSAPEAYQRYGVPALGTAIAQDLVALATLQPGERVLDVACGTGEVTRQAAHTVSPLVGAPISCRHGSVMALPLPEASFDVVLCQWGIACFP